MSLPQFQTLDKDMAMLQNTWATYLNPVLANVLNNSLLLQNIALAAGDNVIQHKLGRKMQGWFVVDQDSAATFYRNEPLNAVSLTLNSSAPTTIKLMVF